MLYSAGQICGICRLMTGKFGYTAKTFIMDTLNNDIEKVTQGEKKIQINISTNECA